VGSIVSKKLSLTAAAVLLTSAGFAAFVATQPATYRVARSTRMAAPPAVVLAHLTDLRRWSSWTSWPHRDAESQQTYGGPVTGVGSSVYWSRGIAAGGRMTIVGATADQVELEVELEAQGAASDVELRVTEEGSGARVTWSVDGALDDATFLRKVRSVLSGEKKAIARDLDAGLARLRIVAEAQAKIESYRVERSASIAAAPDRVLAEIADLRRWAAWSPWERLDHQVHRTYGGSPSGTGASYYWPVDGAPGQARITVIRATPAQVDLELELPGEPPRDLELRVVAEGASTRVTWVMPGEEDARGAVAARFDKGLARLKSVVESETVAAR
jgi:hypothetical protein